MEEAEKFEALEQERKELRLLMNEGMAFSVPYTEKVRTAGFAGWLKRLFRCKGGYTSVEKVREFLIKEPTAFTLDRLSVEYLELVLDENKIKDNPRQEARRLFVQHNRRMARVVAIAVLGNDWEDKKQLGQLTEFFARWLKNSTLWELVQAIDLTNNLADFINSMRLMSSARTTIPNRIESPEG